ncbi:MAG: hypothetical protein H6625_07890 [Bdellovibrionaceae bacterium]|nr:hypothetical protein [Pseudobdellovibrionaceae bacterium]
MSFNKSKSFQIVIIFLIFSLGLHFCLYFSLKEFLPPLNTPSKLQPIEIQLAETSKDTLPQQFVTDPELGELTKKLQQQSQLLSKLTRRVKEQQVASQSGPSRNQIPKQATKNPIYQNKKKNQKLKIENLYKTFPEGLDFKKESEETFSNSDSTYSPPSTIAEHIPNVKKGHFTALNTDQFTYYAFFKRINEQIRLRWVNRIKVLSYTLPASFINQLALSPREAKVELVLNAKGEFVNAFVDQSSGFKIIDQAPIDSFIEATPFINPPQDLVDSDGYIRLNYSFFIEWQPRYIANEKSPGK